MGHDSRTTDRQELVETVIYCADMLGVVVYRRSGRKAMCRLVRRLGYASSVIGALAETQALPSLAEMLGAGLKEKYR